MKSRLIPVILTAALTSVMTLVVATHYQDKVPYFAVAEQPRHMPVSYASYTNSVPPAMGSINFENAAEASVKAVVHIKTITKARTVMANSNDMFSQLFGPRQYYIPQQNGSGSGVVISPDGYIVTNNHVVAEASEVAVTFNDRYTAKAKVVGTDPASDIAVLKVEGDKDLPYMAFGNSDDAKLGQWVLAVGYPLSLDATVTAGIISAKGRSLGINKTQSAAIESFIQTDAAVNPGNSGGALVNTAGQLIGINSAIASPTGSYAGYSYAIPANIVRKVVNDLMKYGNVQMPVMGIRYVDARTASPEDVARLGLDKADGVYVEEVIANSGAAKAGITKGDFITHINGQPVNNKSEVQGQIARFQPGDNVSVNYQRDGKTYSATVLLTNTKMNTDILKPESAAKLLGATFRPLSDKEKASFNTNSGLMVTDIGKGLLSRQTQIRRGFVITGINDAPVQSVNDLEQAMSSNKPLQIGGFYPGYQGMYYYGLNGARGGDE
jgi:serine protease Do